MTYRKNGASKYALLLLCSMFFNSWHLSAAEFRPDTAYFTFGQIFKVAKPATFDRANPHQIAQYCVFLCKEGQTSKMVKEIRHVEKDKKLGESFTTFLKEFGPDLERFKGKSLYLKFAAYQDGKTTSVWYYYLVDAQGSKIVNSSWVSLHRSKTSGKCALTGIFLNTPENAPHRYMPKGLKKAK